MVRTLCFHYCGPGFVSLPYGPTLTSLHDNWKNHSFDSTDFGGKVMSLLFNLLSRFEIVFLSRTNLWESLLKFS